MQGVDLRTGQLRWPGGGGFSRFLFNCTVKKRVKQMDFHGKEVCMVDEDCKSSQFVFCFFKMIFAAMKL